jgi:DNA polymerase-3 subunit gamma/tau
MSYQVLARKWRPRNLQEIVGQEHVLKILSNALNNQRLHHAYLFTGMHGVGKTTFGRIFAKCLNCETGVTSTPCGNCKTCQAIDAGRFLDLIEVDAASRTKVEDTRELLDNVQYQPTQGRYKVYLIDEAHMLSGHSFNALLKTLEEPPPYIKFLLATTDPKRLPVTVLSRCLQFNLKRIPPEQIAQHLQHICNSENVAFEMPALQSLAHAADGSLRNALSLLDQTIAFCNGNITTADTRHMLGNIEQDGLFRLLHALADNNGKKCLAEITHLAEQAPDFDHVLEDLLSLFHQISIKQLIPDSTQQPEINDLAKRFSAEDVQLYYQIALIGRRDLSLAPHPQYGFEMILLRMLAFRPIVSTSTISPASMSPSLIKNTELTIKNSTQHWGEILAKLNLSGLSHALASNCELEKITANKIHLTLAENHRPMFNKKLMERIEHALNNYFNKPMKLDINIVSSDIHTVAKEQQEIQEKNQNVAEEAIKNDPNVQKIIGLFDATLDITSIKSQ